MRKNKQYLTKRQVSILTLSMICIFLVGQVLLFYFNYEDSKRSLENNLTNIMSSVGFALTEAVWDYDDDQIEGIGASVFLHREITELTITDDLTGIVFERKDQGDENQRTYKIEHVISRKGQRLGILEAYYTNSHFLKDIFYKILIEGVLFLAILLAILYVVNGFTKRVAVPILLLSEHAMDIENNINDPIDIKTDSIEINQLIRSFTLMKERVNAQTQNLQLLNENLEIRVEDRTKELNHRNKELNDTISLLKEAELELMKASKLELTQQLLSGIAHGINTPLGNAITLISYLPMNLSVLKKKFGETEEILSAEETVEHIGKDLDNVVKLMSRFKSLDFRSSVSFEKEVVLRDVINNSFQLLSSIETCNIELELICDPEITIHTKPFILMEVIKQLTENACTHAYKKTEIAKILLSCRIKNGKVCIHFEDFGEGMDNVMVNRAFTPFTKEFQTSSGSGIGLSIVENLVVNGLNGHIECHSTKGSGTCFEMSFNL